jgi:23S rRNA (guanosine2251-2'-O)-methyltransferase
MQKRLIYGFHAVTARLRRDPRSVSELYVDAQRNDGRMRELISLAKEGGIDALAVAEARLNGLAGHAPHQGVVALASSAELTHSIDDLLDALTAPPLLLILDGITDPHNLGACLRVADGAGAHAVIAPKDRACGLNATAAKVASGAAESVPYITVTNLARTLRELKERDIFVVGTADSTEGSIFDAQLNGPLALVLGAEGEGMRRLTRETCDQLVSIPMLGATSSLNVSVASGICLYEAVRQRSGGAKRVT